MHPGTHRRLGLPGRIVRAVLGLQFVLLGPALLELHAPDPGAGDPPVSPAAAAASAYVGPPSEAPGGHEDAHDCRMCALWLSAPSLPGAPTALAPPAQTRVGAAYPAVAGGPVPSVVPQPPVRAPPQRA